MGSHIVVGVPVVQILAGEQNSRTFQARKTHNFLGGKKFFYQIAGTSCDSKTFIEFKNSLYYSYKRVTN